MKLFFTKIWLYLLLSWKLCFSFEHYRKIVESSFVLAVQRIITLILWITLFHSIALSLNSYNSFEEIYNELKNHYQSLSLSEGQIIATPSQDFTKEETSIYRFEIRPNDNKYPVGSKFMVVFQILKNSLFIKGPESEYELKYPKNMDVELNENLLKKYKKMLIFGLFPISFLILLLLTMMNRLIEILMIGLALKILNGIKNPLLQSNHLWKISIYTLVPVLIFSMFMIIFNLFFHPLISWIYYGLHFAFAVGVWTVVKVK